jgi:glycylpeptide N-tetradecanoyltransferase
LQPVYSQQEVAHLLFPKKGVIYTYVVEDDEKQVTDFVSFYRLPTQILAQQPGATTHTHIESAYSHYLVATKNEPHQLMKHALLQAKE